MVGEVEGVADEADGVQGEAEDVDAGRGVRVAVADGHRAQGVEGGAAAGPGDGGAGGQVAAEDEAVVGERLGGGRRHCSREERGDDEAGANRGGEVGEHFGAVGASESGAKEKEFCAGGVLNTRNC